MSSTLQKGSPVEGALRRVLEGGELRRLVAEVRGGARVVSVSGLTSGAARALVLAALQRETGMRLAIVVEASRDLEQWDRDLCFWSEALRRRRGADEEEHAGANAVAVLTLPASEGDPYAGASPHAENLERRALTLWRLAQGQGSFVLLTARALARRTVKPEQLRATGATLRRDEDHAPEELIELLLASGYVREDPIGAVGEFSLRGGILDVWSPGHERPVRVEFFGDTVDSIREFDPETQLSVAQLQRIEIVPMREYAVGADDFRLWAELARERWADERYARALRDRTVHADEGETFAGWEWLVSLVHSTPASAFDYLQRETVFVADEPAALETFLGNTYETLSARYGEMESADEIALSPEELYLTAEELRQGIGGVPRVELRTLGRAAAATDERFAGEAEAAAAVTIGRARTTAAPLFLFPAVERAPEIEWNTRAARRYHGRIAELAADVRRMQTQGEARVVFAMPSAGVAERVGEMLAEYNVAARVALAGEGGALEEGQALVTVGRLSGGFELPSAGLIVHVENDLFDEAHDGATVEHRAPGTGQASTSAKRPRKKSKTAAFLSDFRDLKVGDFVVHIDHGIARFGGLQTLDLGPGRRGEFMLLFYADEAKLYVPVERLDLVQRYSSAEGHEPVLDRLGGLGWQKTKAKAKRAMRDMADELLRLYAERKLVGGYAYAADSPWQREFEDGFEYVPTPDQETAIEDVKADMEATTPMDRLLCGDVGYGKTEVAMRAAFKAVMESKQVAVLTPTTVLAYQHYETFTARYAAFPVRVELLSRFRTPKEQKEVVKRVEAGEVDILVGTHRILSKDLKFRDLGLVIVDEEQRFGVAHKERLKQLKKKVDVLTLSATPIPRTLNMSLMGLRDMSIIETPPRDRLAIQTQVVQFGESVIKSGIELELGRGGQVFFIHNRVETIETVAALVKRLVPQARVCVAHGQMNEKEMEAVMLDFMAYKYDVLVATTIIENGIDIPRANTIIINRADHYGLAQLYQLRGRVGRSNRRAYAYLLIPSEQELTPIARRRLAAIREFSDLGAGFRVAALDLELRGAGNLLGGQQSGHMDALGFDLYTQMLERTVSELRGEDVQDETSVSLNLGADVAISEDYISDMGQRLRTYKRIASARDDETLRQIRAETEDRYGRIPESVERLLAYARLRRTAETIGVLSLDRTPGGIAIKLSEKARVAPEKLLALVGTRAGASFTPNGVLRIDLSEEEADDVIETTHGLLLQISSAD
ncbi:MAG TPA: transcription-repair coupling factor [Pyrinomonadaceae bacterium]|jgi:transcription-repair coupling factor (superfamily II helicase)|nr:transcription-repair coupling factor [Pyrinomonadaceae bacterium]